MSTVKVTMDLQKGGNGGTESFYFNGSIATGLAAGINLGAKRIALLVPACRINEVICRGVSPDVARQGDMTDDTYGVNGQIAGQAGDVTNVAALVKFTTTKGYTSRCWLHGCPDEWFSSTVGTGRTYTTADARAAINTYLAYIQAANFQIRGYNRDAAVNKVTVVTGLSTVAGLTTITCAVGFGAVGNQIIVTGTKGYLAKQWRGTYKIVSVVGNVITATKPGRYDPTAIYVASSGKAKLLVADYDTITATKFLRVGTRKWGRIPRVTPGRQSAR